MRMMKFLMMIILMKISILHGDDDDTLPEFDFVPPHSVLVVAGEAIDN